MTARDDPADVARASGARSFNDRIFSVDVLRGLVMVLMAIDHTREYVNISAFSFRADDLAKTTTALFFTRWITHFCAPVFMFTAGLGAALRLQRGGTVRELSTFLWTRGLWLLFLELTAVRLAFFFDFSYDPIFLLVFWSIGMSMIALAGMVYLPYPAILGSSVAVIALHNFADKLTPDQIGLAPWLFNLLHRAGPVTTAPLVLVGYPLIPWVAVIGVGFCFGRLYELPAERRRRLMIAIGAGLTFLYVALRFTNLYGDPSPWQTAQHPVLSFLATTKYPPSLQFLLMTLGPAIIFLGITDGIRLSAKNPLVVFGRTPQFYFIAHLAVIHLFAIALGLARYGYQPFIFAPPPTIGGPPQYPADYGWSLPTTYLVWFAVVVTMYPLCRWLADFKARHRAWWVSYL